MSAHPAPATPAFIRPAATAVESAVGRAVNRRYLADETECVRELLELTRLDAPTGKQVRELAVELVESVRRNRTSKGGLDAFLRQYDLASKEGVILMCLAEALLRIPDADTADRLIADKIAAGNWAEHVGSSDSLKVGASTPLPSERSKADLPVTTTLEPWRTSVKIVSKALSIESVRTNVPLTIATPSTIASDVRTVRSLRVSSPPKVKRIIPRRSPPWPRRSRGCWRRATRARSGRRRGTARGRRSRRRAARG